MALKNFKNSLCPGMSSKSLSNFNMNYQAKMLCLNKFIFRNTFHFMQMTDICIKLSIVMGKCSLWKSYSCSRLLSLYSLSSCLPKRQNCPYLRQVTAVTACLGPCSSVVLFWLLNSLQMSHNAASIMYSLITEAQHIFFLQRKKLSVSKCS